MPVSEPFEFWDMADGETRRIRVTAWEVGETEISPRYLATPTAKRIRVLRLWLAEGIKTTLPNYWDITSKHLIAAMMPYLQSPDYQKHQFTITKHGQMPSARFSMQVIKTEL